MQVNSTHEVHLEADFMYIINEYIPSEPLG